MTRATRAALALVAITLVGCARGVPPTETAQPTSRPPLTTVTPSAAPPSSPSPGPSLPAPTGVRLTGRLPDTKATVPPGEAEAGRVTVHWDVVPGATAYRVERGPGGVVETPLVPRLLDGAAPAS